MMAVTHAAISISCCSLALGTTNPTILALALIGSQLPDADNTKSLIGKSIYPIAAWIEERYPHRTITHSLLATIAISIFCLPLLFFLWEMQVKFWLVIPLSHLFACLADTCTKEGVGLLWPNTVRCIYGFNPNLRLATGSKAEFWVLGFFVALFILSINIQSSGGIMIEFNKVLGIQDGVEQLYDKYGNTNHIWVNVNGVKASDRSPINGQFFLVGQNGQQLILQNQIGIYETEKTLIAKRLVGEIGNQANISEQPLMFNDDGIIDILGRLYYAHPNSAIYLTGELQIDAPEEVVNFSEPGEFEAISKQGKAIILRHAILEDVLMSLHDQFGYGILTAKIITPNPFISE